MANPEQIQSVEDRVEDRGPAAPWLQNTLLPQIYHGRDESARRILFSVGKAHLIECRVSRADGLNRATANIRFNRLAEVRSLDVVRASNERLLQP